MQARIVIQYVLDELKSRQADLLESLVIGTGGSIWRDMSRAQIMKRLEPGFKDWTDGGVLLRVDPANLTGPVIDVEVG